MNPAYPPLSKEQIHSFNTNGYLIVRGMASLKTVQQFRGIAEAALEEQAGPMEYEADVQYPGAPEGRDAEGGDTVRRLLLAYQRHPLYAQWAVDRAITGRLCQLFGSEELYLVQSHHNCVMTKHPRFSSMTNWHQDARYWCFQSPDLISVWLALGREVQANGGMLLIPGTHRMSFDASRYDKEKYLRQDLPENQALIDQAVLCELWPGDVLFFHASLFHAAGQNLARRRKFALVYTYRATGNPPQRDSKSTRFPEIPLNPPGQTDV